MAAPDGPVRTCVGCRERGGKEELVRVVRTSESTAAVDVTGHAPGRGAYVHPRRECLDGAVRTRAFVRALRLQAPLAPVEAARLVEQVEELSGGTS